MRRSLSVINVNYKPNRREIRYGKPGNSQEKRLALNKLKLSKKIMIRNRQK